MPPKTKDTNKATRAEANHLPPVGASQGKFKTLQNSTEKAPIGGAGREALRLLQAKHDQQWSEVQQQMTQFSTDEWDLDDLNTELTLLDQRCKNLSAYEKTFQQWHKELETKPQEVERAQTSERKSGRHFLEPNSSRRKELPPVSPRKGMPMMPSPKSNLISGKHS